MMKGSPVIMVYFLLICTIQRLVEADFHRADSKCVAIIAPDMKSCKEHGHPNIQPSKCIDNIVCRKTFNVTVIDIEPHSSIVFPDMLRHVIDMCCGLCTKVSIIKHLHDVANMNVSSMKTSHIVYPVVGYTDHTHMHGFSFIPMTDETHSYYITRQRTNREVVLRVVHSAASLWPLLIICLFMAVIVGFPIWLIETWDNKAEFPRPFISGLFEGFWWSFISMTTVGYGDRAPKSIVSRLLAIVWILVGITLCSLFTASLTSEITSSYAESNFVITSAKVGILKGRMYDASVVTKSGGYVFEGTRTGLIPGIVELIEKLRSKDIAGFLVDKYTYVHLVKEMNIIRQSGSEEQRHNAEFLLKYTHQKEVKKDGQKLVYGMLIKDPDDFEYFRHFVSDNRPIIQTCKELKMHNFEPAHHDENIAHDIFNPKSGLFMQALLIASLLIGGIFLTGIVYEVARQRKYRKENLSCDTDSYI